MNHASFAFPEQLAGLDAFDAIIDVRSPAEYAEDHLPGAINCPVLDDAQRSEVGTLYTQVSPFAARKIGAAMVAENIARHLRQSFLEQPKNWRPLIYCWRGGQRSGSLTLVMRQIGWNARQLEGGYKSYRRFVVGRLAEVPQGLTYQVVCGATGSAKSRVLRAIAGCGGQVLDLEDLARHKGSVLGALPNAEQPSQKAFESMLLQTLLAFDPARPVFVEAESRKIGGVQIPDALIATMRASPCLAIEAGFAARVDFLRRDYAYFADDVDWLVERLETLRSLRGNEAVNRWIELARTPHAATLIADLLENHYDPLYCRSQAGNYAGHRAPRVFRTDDLSEHGIERLAQDIMRDIEPTAAIGAVRPSQRVSAQFATDAAAS